MPNDRLQVRDDTASPSLCARRGEVLPVCFRPKLPRVRPQTLLQASAGGRDSGPKNIGLIFVTSTLERAIAIAAEAHAGQVDKAGKPYILHPLRVMLRQETVEERIAAVLHDIVEDCGWSIDDLRAAGFSPAVLRAVESVTRKDGESYDAFVARAAADPIGRRVKLADLEDNSDPSRIVNPTDRDRLRQEKYQRAIRFLRESER